MNNKNFIFLKRTVFNFISIIIFLTATGSRLKLIHNKA